MTTTPRQQRAADVAHLLEVEIARLDPVLDAKMRGLLVTAAAETIPFMDHVEAGAVLSLPALIAALRHTTAGEVILGRDKTTTGPKTTTKTSAEHGAAAARLATPSERMNYARAHGLT